MFINANMVSYLAATYPRTLNYLMGPFLATAQTDKVRAAYETELGANEDQVRSMLTLGAEPELMVVPYLDDAIQAANHARPDIRSYEIDRAKPGFMYGSAWYLFPDKVMVDLALVEAHERDEGWEPSPAGMLSLLGVSLLHEMAHWLWHQTKDYGEPREMGHAFERRLYGYDGAVATEDNSPILHRWIKKMRCRRRWS